VLFTCGWVSCSPLVYGLAFFELMPKFKCWDVEIDVWYGCQPE
jgi:hypothetical protein